MVDGQKPLVISVLAGCGSVDAGFVRGACSKKEADVLETFMLALACAGVDVAQRAFVEAMRTTLETLAA